MFTPRAGGMARDGYRKLSRAELESQGFSPRSERYENPAGEIISRRQYDNLRYTDAGWKNRDDFERRFRAHRGMRGYKQWRDAAIQSGAVTRRQADDPNSEFNKRYLKARAQGFDKTARGRRPNSAFAKFLSYIGLRNPDTDFPVGSS